MENKVKLNMTVAPSIKQYLETQAEGFGMSVSAFMTLIVNQYRQQTEVMSQLAQFQTYLDQIKEIADKTKDIDQRK